MVLPRVFTALIMLPFVLIVIWIGSLPYFLFICALCFISLWEYSLMAEEGGYPNQLVMSFIGGMALLLSFYLDGLTLGNVSRNPGPLFVFTTWFFLVFIREFYRKDKGYSMLRVITTVVGVIFCAFLLGHLVLLRDLRLIDGEGFKFIGREIVYFLFFVIWAVDSGAWLIGRWIGRLPLAPRLSPKKTWEGAIGGTLFACFVGWFLREAFLKQAFGPLEAVVYAAIISFFAQMSDLIESLIKRSFGVKDSSDLLPGHGGMLDRF